MAGWEAILTAAAALLMVFFFGRGIKGQLAKSREVPSNWPALVLPAVALILFVLVLISLVRG